MIYTSLYNVFKTFNLYALVIYNLPNRIYIFPETCMMMEKISCFHDLHKSATKHRFFCLNSCSRSIRIFLLLDLRTNISYFSSSDSKPNLTRLYFSTKLFSMFLISHSYGSFFFTDHLIDTYFIFLRFPTKFSNGET